MTTPVEVRFAPRSSDLTWVTLGAMRDRRVTWWFGILFFCVAPPVVAVLLIVASLHFGRPIDWVQVVGLALIPLLAYGFVRVMPRLMFRNSPAMRGEHHYRFDDAGLRFVGTGFDSRVEWSMVTRARWCRGGLLLMSGRVAIVSIPDRAFDATGRDELMRLLQSRQVPIEGWRGDAGGQA
jgi:hypothetical protein